MKILGAILCILGLVAAINVMSSAPPPGLQQQSESYQKGYRLGRNSVPVIMILIGLRLLLRNRSSNSSPRTPRAPQYQVPQSPPPPPMPTIIPVKIQCTCGQNYAFDVQPVAGRMSTRVACPACGVDGTDAANASIAQTLAAQVASTNWPQQYPVPAAPQRKFHPALLVGIGVVAVLFFVMVGSFFWRQTRVHRMSPRAAPYDGNPPDPSRIPSAGRPTGKIPPTAAGSARDAAPVPDDATTIEVYWGTRWWPATIRKRNGASAFVHYDGWSAGSDEWVGPDRMRPRR